MALGRACIGSDRGDRHRAPICGPSEVTPQRRDERASHMVGTGLGTMAATDQGGGGGLAPGGGTAWDSAIGLRWLAACGMSHSGISMGLCFFKDLL